MDSTGISNLTIVLFIGMAGMFIMAFAIVFFVLAYKKKMIEQELTYQQELIQRAIDIQENERKRFAEDLHDEIGGGISTALLSVANLSNELRNDAQVNSQIEQIHNQLINLLDNVREISYNITPEALESYGLEAALVDLFYPVELSEKIKLKFSVNRNENRLAFSQELAIYRICKELLGNTIKHAKASKVTFIINHDEEEFEFIYQDNGTGFKRKPNSTGQGMKNMTNRALFLGADFTIDSKRQEGMQARLVLQLNKKHEHR